MAKVGFSQRIQVQQLFTHWPDSCALDMTGINISQDNDKPASAHPGVAIQSSAEFRVAFPTGLTGKKGAIWAASRRTGRRTMRDRLQTEGVSPKECGQPARSAITFGGAGVPVSKLFFASRIFSSYSWHFTFPSRLSTNSTRQICKLTLPIVYPDWGHPMTANGHLNDRDRSEADAKRTFFIERSRNRVFCPLSMCGQRKPCKKASSLGRGARQEGLRRAQSRAE